MLSEEVTEGKAGRTTLGTWEQSGGSHSREDTGTCWGEVGVDQAWGDSALPHFPVQHKVPSWVHIANIQVDTGKQSGDKELPLFPCRIGKTERNMYRQAGHNEKTQALLPTCTLVPQCEDGK